MSAIGAFTAGVDGNGIHQSASSTGGVLASFRYLFTGSQGLEVDYSHAQFTQQYANVAMNTGVHSDLDEFTASYVLRYPSKRVSPFLSAGTGAVMFSPSGHAFGISLIPTQQPNAVFAYGGGVDIRCTGKLFFRAAYRGLVYDAPNFGIPGIRTGGVTHLAEPVAGFGFRF